MEKTVKFYEWFTSLGGDVSHFNVENINVILDQKSNRDKFFKESTSKNKREFKRKFEA